MYTIKMTVLQQGHHFFHGQITQIFIAGSDNLNVITHSFHIVYIFNLQADNLAFMFEKNKSWVNLSSYGNRSFAPRFQSQSFINFMQSLDKAGQGEWFMQIVGSNSAIASMASKAFLHSAVIS